MVFTVKVAHNMEIVKIVKLTKIFGGNPLVEIPDCAQVWSRKRLTDTLSYTLSQNIYS